MKFVKLSARIGSVDAPLVDVLVSIDAVVAVYPWMGLGTADYSAVVVSGLQRPLCVEETPEKVATTVDAAQYAYVYGYVGNEALNVPDEEAA